MDDTGGEAKFPAPEIVDQLEDGTVIARYGESFVRGFRTLTRDGVRFGFVFTLMGHLPCPACGAALIILEEKDSKGIALDAAATGAPPEEPDK